MSRRLIERRTWLLLTSSCAAAVPFGITQSIYPVYMSGLSFHEGWISVVIAVRSIGPVVIGPGLRLEDHHRGGRSCSTPSAWEAWDCASWRARGPKGLLLLGLCIAGLGMAGGVADLLNQVQAVDLSRASDRSAVMAATGLGWNMAPMAIPLLLGWAADAWGVRDHVPRLRLLLPAGGPEHVRDLPYPALGEMAPFDFAPLALRYAQGERFNSVPVLPPFILRCPTPFVLSVAERQRSEVEGRKQAMPFRKPLVDTRNAGQ